MTVAQSTEARLAITAALTAAGLPAFPYVPKTVSTPAVIVIPDDPYLIPNRVGSQLSMEVAFVVACIAQGNDTEAAVAQCEALSEAVIVALPDGVWATRVSRPSLDSLGAQGSIYVAEVTVRAQVQDDAHIPTIPGGGTGGVVIDPNLPPTSMVPGVDNLNVDTDRMGGGPGSADAARVWVEPHLDDGELHWVYFTLATTFPAGSLAGSVGSGTTTTTERLRMSNQPVHVAEGTRTTVGQLMRNGTAVLSPEIADWIDAGAYARVQLTYEDLGSGLAPVITITDLHTPTTTP
jgi:hypothetical protein